MSTMLTGSDFVYLGSFRLPFTDNTGRYNAGDQRISFAQTANPKGFPGGIGFNPPNGSNGPHGGLYLQGDIGINSLSIPVAEVSIPDLITPSPQTIDGLPTATIVQNFGELGKNATSGLTYMQSNPHLNGNGCGWGGMVNFNHPALGQKIFWNFFGTYSDNIVDGRVFGWSSTDLSVTSATGAGVNSTTTSDNAWGLDVGADCGGYIADIPSNWQTAFNNRTHYCGLAGPSIISRESAGPSMYGFNLADIGVVNPASSDTFLYYPPTDSTRPCNNWQLPGVSFDLSVIEFGVGGSFFFDDGNKKGVVFLGLKPAGAVWYGEGSFEAWRQLPGSLVSGVTPPAIPPNPHYWGMQSGGGTWTAGGPFQDTTDIPPPLPGFSQPPNFVPTLGTNCPAVLVGATAATSGGIGGPNDPYYTSFAGAFAEHGVQSSLGSAGVFWIYDPQDIANAFAASQDPSTAQPRGEYLLTDLSPGNPNPFPGFQPGVPFGASPQGSAGMAFDRATKKVYVITIATDAVAPQSSIQPTPLIHVYQITSAAPAKWDLRTLFGAVRSLTAVAAAGAHWAFRNFAGLGLFA